MEEREKEKEKEEKKEEFLGLKLKRGSRFVGKSKCGVYTPPPSWNIFQNTPLYNNNNNNIVTTNNNNHNNNNNNNNISHNCNNNVTNANSNVINCGSSSSVTARQLGANLWEILPHLNSLANMSRNNNNFKFGSSSLLNSKGLHLREDPLDSASDEQAASTGSFHREIAATLLRHHRSVNRNGREIQPVSPASYSSSMEVTPYNPVTTPGSSQGRMGDPNYGLKTSTELLKVLNRIWSLEEQHASNVSLLKALKSELDNSRTRIKDLLREKQKDRQVMDDLMKQVAEHKPVKRNTDQDRIQSALQSVRQELEDERKLRKRSESLHRKMAREISDMKSSFSKALNELEKERRARILLEDLCDEFAMGIRDYEQEFRSQKYRNEKEQIHRGPVDNLVLHISEAWLDERVQMKLAEQMRKDMGGNCMIVDKLRPEIETFLKARQTLDSREDGVNYHNKSSKGSGLRRQSLESFPLNEATSAPKHFDDEDDNDSVDSDSNCFELTKNLGGEYTNGMFSNNIDTTEEAGLEEAVRTDVTKRKVEGQELNNGRSLSSLQARFEKRMSRMTVSNGHAQDEEEGILERRSKRFWNRGANSNHMLDNLLRNNSSSIEGKRIHPESELPNAHSLLPGSNSPVKNWESKISSQNHEISESSSNWQRGCKESTLKARLLEARLEGRNNQSKGSKGAP